MDWEMELTERERMEPAFSCRRNLAGGHEGQLYEKNEKGISPILAGGTGKRPLYSYCSEVLSIQNRKAVWLSP